MDIQGWQMPCEREDTTSFTLRNWIGKGGLIQINSDLPLNKDDVFLIST